MAQGCFWIICIQQAKKHGPHCYTDNKNRLLYDRYNIVNGAWQLLLNSEIPSHKACFGEFVLFKSSFCIYMIEDIMHRTYVMKYIPAETVCEAVSGLGCEILRRRSAVMQKTTKIF